MTDPNVPYLESLLSGVGGVECWTVEPLMKVYAMSDLPELIAAIDALIQRVGVGRGSPNRDDAAAKLWLAMQSLECEQREEQRKCQT